MMTYNQINQPFGANQVTNLDFDLSFLPNPSTSDLRTKSNLDSIKQSMYVLLFTNSGERPFQSNLACNMQQMLFDELDQLSLIMLQREISSTLSAYEPRIQVLAINVSIPAGSPNSLNIQISFSLINSPNVETLSVFLDRVR